MEWRAAAKTRDLIYWRQNTAFFFSRCCSHKVINIANWGETSPPSEELWFCDTADSLLNLHVKLCCSLASQYLWMVQAAPQTLFRHKHAFPFFVELFLHSTMFLFCFLPCCLHQADWLHQWWGNNEQWDIPLTRIPLSLLPLQSLSVIPTTDTYKRPFIHVS